MNGFLEALNFRFHALDMNVIQGNQGPTLNLPRQRHRRIELKELAKAERKQARVLFATEANALEDILEDERESIVHRVAPGTFLFCRHSRSKWNDIRKVYHYSHDISPNQQPTNPETLTSPLSGA